MSLISTAEIRRLEKAARDKNKKKLADWAVALEQQIIRNVTEDMERRYALDVRDAWNNLFLALAYTIFGSEETKFNKEDIHPFLSDLFVTIDMYRTGEYKPDEYKQILEDNGVILDEYDYKKIYKDFIKVSDNELINFFRNDHRRKIITIVGSPAFKGDILNYYKTLTLNGNMVFIDGINVNPEPVIVSDIDLEEIIKNNQNKILLSDEILVVNTDNKIDMTTAGYIKYAKEHNKEIKYTVNKDKTI